MAVYFKIQMQYKRKHDGKIIETTGRRCNVAEPYLDHCLIAKQKHTFSSKVLRVTRNSNPFTFTSTDFPSRVGCLRVCEADFSSHVSGIFLNLGADNESDKISVEGPHIVYDEAPSSTKPCIDPSKLDEYDRFALIFLSQEHAARYPPPMGRVTMQINPPYWLVKPISNLFERTLLSLHPKDDRWGTGSAAFETNLKDFIYRKDVGSNLFTEPVQFCLPAFPCKSTNPRKTSGPGPDAAEFEALLTIHEFCVALQRKYGPGADFVIVSDGHVFSDCVGIDDGDVYKYTNAVRALSDKIYARIRQKLMGDLEASEGDEENLPLKSPVRFVSLRDIFHPPGSDFLDRVAKVDLNDCEIYRPVNTKIDPKDEENRKMMMRSCGFEQGVLDKMIEDNPDCSLTATYRGFIRFMDRDLEAHNDFRNLSPTQRKNVAEAVAKTMIYRNQAYSHLVELVFPRAIRLSIHQHNNEGPKFAVNLLPNTQFRNVESLKPDALRCAAVTDHAEETKVDEAHIPTPWHNVIVQVEDHEMMYVCAAGVVKDELVDPLSPYNPETSGWNENYCRYMLNHRDRGSRGDVAMRSRWGERRAGGHIVAL